MPIPKIAHVVWNHREVVNSDHPLIVHGLRNLIKLNPDWKVTVYTPEDIDTDLKNWLDNNDYVMMKEVHFVSKIDLWRQFKMYKEGGLYMDLDRLYNIPMCDIIDQNTLWILPTTKEYDVSCDFMCSAPGNPVFKRAYEMYLDRRKNGWNKDTDQYFLGPQTYMHAVTLELCGEIINTDPGKEKFEIIRKKIAELPFAKTYREIPYNDMIVYQGKMGDDLEWIKRDFYAKEGVKHWTGDW